MAWLRKFVADTKKVYRSMQPLDPMNISYEEAMKKGMTERELLRLRELLRRKDPFKFAQLQLSVRWARRVLLKYGEDPETVRWLV